MKYQHKVSHEAMNNRLYFEEHPSRSQSRSTDFRFGLFHCPQNISKKLSFGFNVILRCASRGIEQLAVFYGFESQGVSTTFFFLANGSFKPFFSKNYFVVLTCQNGSKDECVLNFRSGLPSFLDWILEIFHVKINILKGRLDLNLNNGNSSGNP